MSVKTDRFVTVESTALLPEHCNQTKATTQVRVDSLLAGGNHTYRQQKHR